MSAASVTRFVDNVAEFTSLEQWEREHDLFEQIIQIPLFKQYRMWKAYSVWRRNVRARKMAAAESVLRGKLFHLNSSLRPALLEARAAGFVK